MKMFLVTACVKCGHKVFSLEKRISADTAMDAVKAFKEDYPNSKMIRTKLLCNKKKDLTK